MAFKIYTRGGDAGETALYGGERRNKDDVRVEAYGTVDELNAALGVVIAHCDRPAAEPSAALPSTATLRSVQADLFALGSRLACPPDHPNRPAGLAPDTIAGLERAIDEAEAELKPLANFILPGGTRASAAAHVARTVARRAERRVVALSQMESCDPIAIAYLNRLSDYLFVFARLLNHRSGVADVPWSPARESAAQ